MNIPIAIDAEPGELGGNGLLITEKHGARVRIFMVITELPLGSDEPIEFGVARFCEVCGLCAQNCPAQVACRW